DRRIEFLKLAHTDFDQRLYLIAGENGCIAKQQGMAEQNHPLLPPAVEVTDGQALIHPSEQLINRGIETLGDLDVIGAGELDGAQVRPPGEPKMILAPASFHTDGQLIVPLPVEGPVIVNDDAFDEIKGIGVV